MHLSNAWAIYPPRYGQHPLVKKQQTAPDCFETYFEFDRCFVELLNGLRVGFETSIDLQTTCVRSLFIQLLYPKIIDNGPLERVDSNAVYIVIRLLILKFYDPLELFHEHAAVYVRYYNPSVSKRVSKN